MGYRETGVLPIGLYTVNEVTVQSPPKTLMIKGHATNLMISLKEKVSREWHQITLGDLVKGIANKHGYGYKVAEEFKDILIPHIDQTEESDINLLTRIAIEREAMAKLAGGYILFIPKGAAKSVTGKALGTTTIRPQDTIQYYFLHQHLPFYPIGLLLPLCCYFEQQNVKEYFQNHLLH